MRVDDVASNICQATPQRKLPEHEVLRGDVVVPPERVRVAVGVEAHVVGIHLDLRTDQIFRNSLLNPVSGSLTTLKALI